MRRDAKAKARHGESGEKDETSLPRTHQKQTTRIKRRSEGTRGSYYPLRSLTRSPAVGEPPSDPDPVAPAAECARLRPIITPPSSSSSETRNSARSGVVAAAVIVSTGRTKYRPIELCIAAFAAPPIPPLSSALGGETAIRWLGIGDCFLY